MKRVWTVLLVAAVGALVITVFADLGWAQLLGPRVPGGPGGAPPQPGMGGPPRPGMPGAGYRPPRPQYDEDTGTTEEGGGETVTYDLPRARRLMGECEQLITRGKSQLESNDYRGAISAFADAKQKIELVRGWYQEQTEGTGEGGAAPPAAAPTRTGVARVAPTAGPAMAGGEGGEAALQGLIPPGETADLLRARRIHANILLGLGDGYIGQATQKFNKGEGTGRIWTLVLPGSTGGEAAGGEQ